MLHLLVINRKGTIFLLIGITAIGLFLSLYVFLSDKQLLI